MNEHEPQLKPASAETFPDVPPAEIADPSDFIQKAKEALAERHAPGLPKLSIEIFFTSHQMEKDAEPIADRLAKADMFIPEFANWGKDDPTVFNSLTRGAITPDTALESLHVDMFHPFYAFIKKEFEAMYQSHKPVVLIDIPHGHPLSREIEALMRSPAHMETFAMALTQEADYCKRFMELQEQREAYMVEQLASGAFLKEYPELKEKKELHLLLSLGNMHTPVYHAAGGLGSRKMTLLEKSPRIFSRHQEVDRRYRFHKDVSNELLAQALCEIIILQELGAIIREGTGKSEYMVHYLRAVVGKFSFQEIKELYESDQRHRALLTALERKGVSVPRSEEHMKEILA